MGVLTGAYNTTEVNVGAYNTIRGRVIIKYYSIGYGPWCHGLTCELCLAFLRTPSVPSERASLVGSGAPVEE